MKSFDNFFPRFLASIAAAALIANTGMLWRLNDRLTRIEIRLDFEQRSLATSKHSNL